MAQGRPYPRTCPECGLGPCRYYETPVPEPLRKPLPCAAEFDEAWTRTGYQYGEDALSNVRVGWRLACETFGTAAIIELRREKLQLEAELLNIKRQIAKIIA